MHCCLAGAIGVLAVAQSAARPVLDELLTAERCSSCSPTDSKGDELVRVSTNLLLLNSHATDPSDPGWGGLILSNLPPKQARTERRQEVDAELSHLRTHGRRQLWYGFSADGTITPATVISSLRRQ